MKCPKCRAEIISNTVKTCPYCGTPLNIPLTAISEKNKKAEHAVNHETREIAEKIKEAIETQKAIYKLEKADITKKLKKAEKEAEKKLERKVVERKKYSTSDIIILFISLILTFFILALALSLLLRR